METLRATTPTRSLRVRTPEAPKHGFSDNWAPYSPRKSARLSERANPNHNVTRHNRTPSPHPDARIHSTPAGSPRQSSKKLSSIPRISMTSPPSPQKKRQPKMDTLHRASGTSITSVTETRSTRLTTMAPAAGLLPTPAKTPQKAPSPKSKAKVQAIARNLFHPVDEVDEVVEAMSSPRKTRCKKPLDSFGLDNEDDSIAIFTDSQDRVPEVDVREENPFYVAPGAPIRAPAPEPPRRRSKRQTVTVPGEGRVSIEEAIQREDGMLIVFRGKKQFRKFAELDDVYHDEHGLDEADGGLDNAVESRRITRSSVKPRLLFPAPEHQISFTDEEAETDIEDHIAAQGKELDTEKPHTPMEMLDDKMPDTPVAPKFAPVSPPTTMRTTRHGIKAAEETTPKKPVRGRSKRSPFDGWRRVKGSPGEGPSLKRSGDSLTADDAKRTRL